MGKKHLLLLTAFLPIFLIFAPVNAQQINQNPSNLQQQQTGAQSTGTPQTDTAPVQQNNSGEALSQNQPSSLGVVSSPKQTKPSVTVGPSSGSNLPSPSSPKGTNYTIHVILILLALVVFVLVWMYRRSSDQKIASEVNTPPKATSKKIAAKTDGTSEEQKLNLSKKPVKKTKKKKKKSTHR